MTIFTYMDKTKFLLLCKRDNDVNGTSKDI